MCLSNLGFSTLSAAFTRASRQTAVRRSRALGLGLREISIAAGTGADVMAGSAGTEGPAPHVHHKPQGYPVLFLSLRA